MTSATTVFGAPTRRTDAGRVYRLRTANSTYELEVRERGAMQRCAVLSKLDGKNAVLQRFEDSAPRIGGRSLFDVSPLEWIGLRLAVGTVCTTELESVDFLERSSARAPAPASSAPTPWAPFPLGQVEMLEAAASVLGAVCHRHELLEALTNEPLLARRFQLALAQCGLLIETLMTRSTSR